MGVDAVVKDIQKDLGGTGWFGATTSGDIKHADQDIGSLNASDANAVVAKLSDADLKSWADNANSSAPWNGLSAGEKRDLLNDMAGKLDGTQLGRVSKAFGVDDVSDAVASHASATTKADFIKSIAPDISAKDNVSAGFGSVKTTTGNDAARGAIKVLQSLGDNRPGFDSAVRSLDGAGKLGDLAKVAAGKETDTVTAGGGMALPNTSFAPSALNSIVSAAAASQDLSVRTAVFNATAPQLADMQQSGNLLGQSGNDAAASVAKSMSGLLTPAQAKAAGVVPTTPIAPPGVSLQQNIADASKNGAIWVTTQQVPNKHPWDYKQQGAQYQDFGNFNYGVAEAAAGLPEDVALRGAGDAQVKAGTSKPEWGDPKTGPLAAREAAAQLHGAPYGDDPADQAQIKAGYDYFNSGLWRLWSQ